MYSSVLKCYRKIPKISPGAYIFQRPSLEGLYSERLMNGGKFTIFALFYSVLDGKFQVQAPRVAYIRRGDLKEVFLRCDFGGHMFGMLRYYSNFSDPKMLSFVN